jgi:hypothetical protein
MKNLHDRLSTALRDGRLRTGGLVAIEISPDAATNLEHEQGRMYLTSDLAPTTLATLLRERERAVVGSEILGVASDWAAWVVSYACKSAVQRMLIPLFGADTARLIERAAQGSVFLVFTSSDEELESVLEDRLQVSASDLNLLRQHWRLHAGPEAPDRLLQSMDILLFKREVAHAGAHDLHDAVTVILTPDLQRQLSDLMPGF